ncbi:MAG: hypothetical protein ACQEW8_09750 [Actinomycetota bacterium]
MGASLLAVLAVTGVEGALMFFFPQVAFFHTGFGVVTVSIILVAALANTLRGIDVADRLYRFYGGLTLASTIMFVTYIVGVVLVLAWVESSF